MLSSETGRVVYYHRYFSALLTLAWKDLRPARPSVQQREEEGEGLAPVPGEGRPGMETAEPLLLGWGGEEGGGRGWGWDGGHIKELSAVAFTLALIVYALIWLGASMLCSVILRNLCHLRKHRSGTEAERVSLSLQQLGQHFFRGFFLGGAEA